MFTFTREAYYDTNYDHIRILRSWKTTYLQHILNCGNTNERILIIENDFGETSLDAKQLSASGATVREVTSGCICCSLQGNFKMP